MSISGSKNTGFFIFIINFCFGLFADVLPIAVKNCFIVTDDTDSKIWE